MNIFEKIDCAKELVLFAENTIQESIADVLLHQYYNDLQTIKISDLT